jgi:hypothetical protein
MGLSYNFTAYLRDKYFIGRSLKNLDAKLSFKLFYCYTQRWLADITSSAARPKC